MHILHGVNLAAHRRLIARSRSGNTVSCIKMFSFITFPTSRIRRYQWEVSYPSTSLLIQEQMFYTAKQCLQLSSPDHDIISIGVYSPSNTLAN